MLDRHVDDTALLSPGTQNGPKILGLRVCSGEGVVVVEVVVLIVLLVVVVVVVVVVVGKHFFVTCRHHQGSHESGVIFM